MKKIISYCLFLPRGMVKHRQRWDQHWNDAERYWYNIPALCVTDAVFYPDYMKRFYVTQDVMDHELGEFFHKIQNVENFEVRVVDDDKYDGRHLIVQRFQPFWEDWDIVLPRDVDSIVTGGEWQCSKVFEESPEAHVYSSRSHRQHNIMMGGLSGFKPKLIQDKIGNNLEEFMETHSLGGGHRWDLDQAILNRAFADDKGFASNRYYDMRIHYAPVKPKFNCKKYVPLHEIQSHSLSSKMSNIVRQIEAHIKPRWAGMPVDLRGVCTKTLLDHNPEIRNIIYSSPKLLEFYHIPFWASEDVWSSDSPLSIINSVKNSSNKPKLPSSWFIPKIYRNPHSHKGDTSRELLSMWDEAGYCKLIDCKSSLSWWGSPEEEVLLYEFNHEKCARIPPQGNIKLGLFANLIPSDWGVPWIFWARRPRALEKRIEGGLLTYEKRDISSIFIGNVGTPEQGSHRRKQDWSQCTEIFSLLNGWSYKYTQEEYLNMMARSKFGLCLAGYGRKCNREPECMGLGVVPIVAPEVDMNYYDSPEEGVHYFRVNSPDQVKEITEGLGETEWKRMSDNCIDWWNRNCSRRGSFETTQRIIEENYPN